VVVFKLIAVFKPIAIIPGVRVKYEELSAWQMCEHIFHVKGDDLSGPSLDSFLALLRCQCLLFIFYFLTNDTPNIIYQVVELSKNDCGIDSHPFKGRYKVVEVLDFLKTASCQVNKDHRYNLLLIFGYVSLNLNSHRTIVDTWNVHDLNTFINNLVTFLSDHILSHADLVINVRKLLYLLAFLGSKLLYLPDDLLDRVI
jgi:hypothetical protein